MKVWIVYMFCGLCGDYEWGGIYSDQLDALDKQAEMISNYNNDHHINRVECEEHEVQ